MKYRSVFLFIIGCIFSSTLVAQQSEDIVFHYQCTPTSTTSYSIEITRSQFTLSRIEKIPGKDNRIHRTDSSKYTYAFKLGEARTLDSIISVYRLDSAGTYKKRETEWGTEWDVAIQENAILKNIHLPNYNNAGLEALIRFVTCLIPQKEHPPFECKKCNGEF